VRIEERSIPHAAPTNAMKILRRAEINPTGFRRA
jgi:hypothetical protein